MVMKTPFLGCGYLNCRPSALLLASNGTSAILNAKATIPDKSSWEGCTQLNLVHFNPQKKRVSSFAKYPRTITRTNVKLFLDIGPGAGEGRKGKKRGQK